MIFERRTQLSLPKLVVNIMTMLYLLLSLFASQTLLVTSCAIEKDQVKFRGEPPSLEAKKTISKSPDPKISEAPWAYSFPEKTERQKDTCHRVPLYVNFISLGLYDDIIAPRGFYVNQCKGKCSSTQRRKFPNRSPIMALLEKKTGLKINDEVCCVPTKLEPLTVLLLDKNNKVVQKKIDDLVVSECGCK